MYFRNILRSFYDLSLYKEVRSTWKGWAMAYTVGVLAMLIAIGMIYTTIVGHTAIFEEREGGRVSVFEEASRQIAAQWPDTVVNDDKLQSDAPMPHIITVDVEAFGERFNEPFITVDTTDTVNYASMTTPVLVTSKEIIIRKKKDDGSYETEIHELAEAFKTVEQPHELNADVMNEHVTQIVAFVNDGIWKFYLLMGFVAWLVLVPIVVLVRILLLIPLALGGLVVATLMRRKIDYDSAVRVIAIALIPLTIVEAFALMVFFSGVSIFIKVLVTLGILYILLKAEPQQA
jgi:hypothetical protein